MPPDQNPRPCKLTTQENWSSKPRSHKRDVRNPPSIWPNGYKPGTDSPISLTHTFQGIYKPGALTSPASWVMQTETRNGQYFYGTTSNSAAAQQTPVLTSQSGKRRFTNTKKIYSGTDVLTHWPAPTHSILQPPSQPGLHPLAHYIAQPNPPRTHQGSQTSPHLHDHALTALPTDVSAVDQLATSPYTAPTRPNTTENPLSSKKPTTVHGYWTASPSAFVSTAPEAARQAPTNAKIHHIFVHSAVAPDTGRNSAPDPRKICTPLLPDKWEAILDRHGLLKEFQDVPIGLQHGFRIGVDDPITQSFTPPNHSSARDRPDIILDHINSELKAGRYSGPFKKSTLKDLIGPFRTAPLGVTEKSSSPGKFRVIQDFSFPRNSPDTHSLNSQINTEDFPCTWGFFADVAKAVSTAPHGSEGASFDVDAAYRRIPIHPLDQPYIVVRWEEDYYVDHAVPFGAASSNGLFARCGDAMALLLEKQGFGRIYKWVDDFLIIRTPNPQSPTLLVTENDVYQFADELGWPWKRSKTKNFDSTFSYLGFTWDLQTRQVHIPEAKRSKYINRINEWLHSPSVSLLDTQKLIGSLVHCSLAIPDGRAHLSGLIKFNSAFPLDPRQSFRRFTKSIASITNANWWKNRLLHGPFGSDLSPPPPNLDIRIHTDASNYGVGIVINNEWSSWHLIEGWKSKDRNIGWAEAIAVELAVEHITQQGIQNATIRIHCDNQGVVLAWKAGRSRNDAQNHTLSRIAARAASSNLWIDLVYINTHDNLADKPSRGIPPPNLSATPLALTAPPHLHQFLVTSIPS
ncbi:polyprotein [Ceratobasidium theobromae]|uniref:Polyprotein n=1 Tax=Ceratobasidium theobromae TaxID=1582974 RepID=A0A5N5Q949_9AGAM|nr:polyprotein [Ceratobasidium theobromae]